jgi:hypothetical protein
LGKGRGKTVKKRQQYRTQVPLRSATRKSPSHAENANGWVTFDRGRLQAAQASNRRIVLLFLFGARTAEGRSVASLSSEIIGIMSHCGEDMPFSFLVNTRMQQDWTARGHTWRSMEVGCHWDFNPDDHFVDFSHSENPLRKRDGK